MSDALTDITENRRDAAPGNEQDDHMAGKHRGSVAPDDREGRREPTGHGRHRRDTAD
ncbi:hypothetical protein GXW82_24425 [Streptacidiphilus sp. 4-A2]|nr:hypothetical protein [Streptacidiphilus sp. 4-A2]